MLFDVYVLGEKTADPVSAMLKKPWQGDLRLRKRYPDRDHPAINAYLYRNPGDDEPALELHYVRLVGMNSGSMVLEGKVGHPRTKSFKSQVDYTTQRWLCKAPGAQVVVDAAVLRRRSTDLTKAKAADPFHPMWDDVPDDQRYHPLDDSAK